MEIVIQHIKQLIVHHVNVSRNDSDIDDSDTNSFLYRKTAKWIDMLFFIFGYFIVIPE